MAKEETSSAEPMSQTTVAIIAVAMLAIGFGAGYYLNMGETGTGGETTTPTTDGFVFDQQKVNEITATFEDYFYVYGQGQPVDLVFQTYRESGDHVDLVYMFNGQPFNISMSKDYQYLYPSVLSYEAFKQDVAYAKTQFEESLTAEPPEPEELEKTETPEVLLFVMSFCPYGNVAEDAMAPVVDLIGEGIYFEPVYIVSGGAGSWTSLHGNVELNQDIREKIIYNLYGADVWMDYVYAVNAQCDYTNADECWTGPAEALGINTTEVEELFNNDTYVDELLTKDAMLSAAYGVRGSPTLIVNGMTMSVERSPESYKSTICDAFLSPHEKCNETLSGEGTAATGSC